MSQKRPNILLIMSDNHPADLLGCYGNDEIQTPNLDRLAAEGMQFNNAFCVNAMCSPCRASVLTGLMPSQHGIHTWLDDRIMDDWPPSWNAIAEFTTLPEVLKASGFASGFANGSANGYKTALIGKYHLGVPFAPQNGFEHWVTFPYGHTRSFRNNTVIENDKQYTYPGHSVDYFTEQAIDYIKAHDPKSATPFFIFLTYNGPYGHWPAIKGPAQNRFAHLYEKTAMTSVPREGLSAASIKRYDLKKHMSGGGIDYRAELQTPNDLTSLRNYFSQMSMVDDGVGRVLAALHQQGLADDTLVVYTCDHGFSLGHNGFWGHGQATWPANTHRPAFSIPLLVRHTGQIEPLPASNVLISQIDLLPTLLDYVGLGVADINPNSPSKSFVPLLRGEPLVREEAVFMEQEETRAIRTPQWLYMKRFKGSRAYPFADELYDLVNDPAEQTNLVAQPGLAGVSQMLSERIDTFFQQYADPNYDLWQGGTAKSNSDKPWLWQDAWGEDWAPVF